MSGQISILCFGDSNTRGTRPDDSNTRYERSDRWTGQLQVMLGSDYYVIEEGLGGRTTDLEHPRTEKLGRNGIDYFKPCLESHSPIDIVIIMLGTNDFKNVYNRTTNEVANVLKRYVSFTKENYPSTRIILVAPAPIVATEPVEFYDKESEKKSNELAASLEQLCIEEQIDYFDAATVVNVGEDGIHWDLASEKKFANSIASIVRNT